MEKNGEVVELGAGAAVLGHPASSVAMLANLLAELIHELDEDTVDWIIAEIRGRRASRTRGGPTH